MLSVLYYSRAAFVRISLLKSSRGESLFVLMSRAFTLISRPGKPDKSISTFVLESLEISSPPSPSPHLLSRVLIINSFVFLLCLLLFFFVLLLLKREFYRRA